VIISKVLSYFAQIFAKLNVPQPC